MAHLVSRSPGGCELKTELIADRVGRSRAQLELAVVAYIAWSNDSRLHQALGPSITV
jgi:hypothetical protein